MKQQTVQDKIEQFFASGVTKFYRKGETIVLSGEDPAGVMFLDSGIAEQYDITNEGNKLVVNMFRPGAFFPMSWAINGSPNTYFYAAFSDVTVRIVDASAAVKFLRENNDVTFDLLSRVYIGTDAIQSRLVFAASGAASERLIFELINEAYRFGKISDDSHALIKIKQVSLAERSGLARETVGRELHKLACDELITVTRQGIKLSLDKLKARLSVNI